MTTRNVAAVDLGAESGRVILARFDGRQMLLEEIYRFPNRPVRLKGHRIWNILSLWDETCTGLRKARQVAGSLDAIGVDTWGVDYALINREGDLIGYPFHYRDDRTNGIMEQVFMLIPREVLYRRTGIQMLPFNTLFQLYAQSRLQPDILRYAAHFLMIPDLLHHWLCGSSVGEQTNATTTQCWNPVTSRWAYDLCEQLGIPSHLFPPVVQAGSALGTVLPSLQNDLGRSQIIAPATHDTGSAIAAIPTTQPDGWAYISSGTWSLIGVERPQPLITSATLAANYTNEGGVFGTTRFLKNIMGLWLLQECLRSWMNEGYKKDYDTLFAEAETLPPFKAFIDPNDPRFLAPADMPTAINAYLIEHGQSPVQEPAAFARCIMESLILRYCEELRNLEQLTGISIRTIHILGGGARNARINQWLATACGLSVIAGPTEATAQGNALMQLVGLNELRTLNEVRTVAQGTQTHCYLPETANRAAWMEAAARFTTLTSV